MSRTNGAQPADCPGCATCDPFGGQPPQQKPRISTIKVRARDEDYRIVQVQVNLFVCSRSNGNCGCGWGEKGRWVFDNEHWAGWSTEHNGRTIYFCAPGCKRAFLADPAAYVPA